MPSSQTVNLGLGGGTVGENVCFKQNTKSYDVYLMFLPKHGSFTQRWLDCCARIVTQQWLDGLARIAAVTNILLRLRYAALQVSLLYI
jgi:hypothetical protein